MAAADDVHAKLASLMDLAASMLLRGESEQHEDADVAHVLQAAAQHLATMHSDAWAAREQVWWLCLVATLRTRAHSCRRCVHDMQRNKTLRAAR